MSEAKRASFTVLGVDYPIPTEFRLNDPVLAEEMTGVDWETFVERQGTGDWFRGKDPGVLAAMIAIAIWQQNPTWSRDKCRRFVEHLSQDGFEWNIPTSDKDEPKGDDDGKDPPRRSRSRS